MCFTNDQAHLNGGDLLEKFLHVLVCSIRLLYWRWTCFQINWSSRPCGCLTTLTAIG